MRNYQKLFIAFYFILSTLSCNQQRDQQLEKSVADSTGNIFVPSSAAVENNKDTTRKFIRTADLKFKVKSVVESTYDIEEITDRHGGFVTFTNLASDITNFTSTAVSADSSLETTYFTVTNSIVIRVPNTKLDTTLKEIATNIAYLDYRVIKAEDVALQILSNKLAQIRSAKSEERISNAIDNRGKKLNETTTAEDLLLSKQEQKDNAHLSNLSLNDQVNFSTINLSIYQRQVIQRELVANEKNLDAYEPGFASKIFESLKYGWSMLEAFLVFLAKLWWIFPFAISLFFIYRLAKSKIR